MLREEGGKKQAEQLLMDANSMRNASPVQENAAKQKVNDVINTIKSHLEDLDLAVVAVENNPRKFGITQVGQIACVRVCVCVCVCVYNAHNTDALYHWCCKCAQLV